MQTLLNLKSQAVYFGSPQGFNDPYDCAITPQIAQLSAQELEAFRARYVQRPDLPQPVRHQFASASSDELAKLLNRAASRMLEEARAKAWSSIGVTCFSERNDDLLMWSHYGGRYKGLCLEFDTAFEPFTKAMPVAYSDKLPTVNPVQVLMDNSDKSADTLVTALLSTKSASWTYEREWRAFHKNAGTVFTYEADALKAVYFGPDISPEALEIVCLLLAGQNSTVRLFRGQRSTTEFKVDFASFTYTPYLEAKRLGLRP